MQGRFIDVMTGQRMTYGQLTDLRQYRFATLKRRMKNAQRHRQLSLSR
jgi:hypothetical protein